MLASSCATTSKPGVPAVLTDVDVDVLAELTDIVSRALSGASITLAPDVLSRKSTLYIERPIHRTMANNPAMGRRMDMPDHSDHFTLSKTGNTCLLTHAKSGVSYQLKKATCRVIENKTDH